jgi:IS30 family transposase
VAKKPGNSGKAWTSSERQQLRRLAAENTPTRVIGLKMNRSEGAIYSQAAKQGTSLKPTNQSPYGTQK